jgi:hypothetical protein
MFGWIPLLGPIIQGVFSIFTKMQDNAIIKYKTDATRDVEEAKISADIIQTTEDDICLRMMRDAAVFPVVVWSFLIGYDTIIAKRWPDWMFHIEKYPDSVAYLPYVVLVFLFGNIGLNTWKRK